MSAIVDALIAELSQADLDALADALAERIAARIAPSSSPWLDVKGAAAYLCAPRSRLYALVARPGGIPHHRDGSRLLFNRAELDQWVRAGGGKRP